MERMGLFLLGGSGAVVNSLDFYPASFKSLGYFYFLFFLLPVCTFFTTEGVDSEFAKFTVPILKAFLKARVRVCLETSKNL